MADHAALGVAFGITAGAGLATSLGAAVVFVPGLYSHRVLGASLALAAGVMIYVSLIEIFVKGLSEFELYFDRIDGINRTLVSAEEYEASPSAYYANTALFFAGVLLTWFLDLIIHSCYARFYPDREHGHHGNKGLPATLKHKPDKQAEPGEDDSAVPAMFTDQRHAENAGLELTRLQSAAVEDSHATAHPAAGPGVVKGGVSDVDIVVGVSGSEGGAEPELDEDAITVDRRTARELMTMALVTGTAIALHNFPEGLATFVATAKDPGVGAPLAVAIAIHNIPEGICVAIPIYFATKSKWWAFFLATASGLAEPVAGAIGWGLLSSGNNNMDNIVYAILFALVSGMMTYISFRELLPTARNYDPKDRWVTLFLFIGMGVMALSLALFF